VVGGEGGGGGGGGGGGRPGGGGGGGGRCVSPLEFWFIGLLSTDVKACTLARDRTSN